ncbi:MAG: YbhB/YbcL family Raf kinase inhibitor-like protein [Deltaproteobacteria bacterium]|nr:YbhB/YbcL family Raf kinase inhibitor-like protein [Deltaproteobacteria bacterium]
MSTLTVSSPSFKDGGAIPEKHAACGENLSPAISWKGLPPGTKSLAIIAEDPDAPWPRLPLLKWVHWIAYNIPASEGGLAEGADRSEQMASGALSGKNSFKRFGYDGPAPVLGRHRYFFRVYALDSMIELPAGKANKKSLLEAMQGRILEQAELMGTFAR